jgi:hypothetical protein
MPTTIVLAMSELCCSPDCMGKSYIGECPDCLLVKTLNFVNMNVPMGQNCANQTWKRFVPVVFEDPLEGKNKDDPPPPIILSVPLWVES